MSGIALPPAPARYAIRSLGDDVLPLLDLLIGDDGRSLSEAIETPIEFKRMTDGAQVVADYNSVGFSRTVHPVHFLRGNLKERAG
ncbi:MAG: hypothetical protein QM647_18735 [Asticcacaulis sp.]|uniref:hypothetical protein n=1 Tax=Asticcacaulis sp. TaxID=1872648 RepID=UPI0039E29459